MILEKKKKKTPVKKIVGLLFAYVHSKVDEI